MLLLLVLQTFIFGHIVLWDCAMPMVYVLFAVLLRRGTGRAESLFWCFAMGLAVDTMQLTPGLTAAAMTLVGFIQPPLLDRMTSRETPDDCIPGYKTIGLWRYVEYVTLLVMLNNTAYFLLESATVNSFDGFFLRLGASTLLTIAITLPIARLRE